MKLTGFKNKVRANNNTIVDGLKLFFEAHQFILRNKLKRYMIISGLLFLVLFSVGINFIIIGVEHVEPFITEWILLNFKKYLNFNVNEAEMKIGIQGGFWLVKTAITSNKDSIFTSVFLIIGTPYFSFIAGKIRELTTKEVMPFSLKRIIKEIVRGLKISIKNSFKQLGLIILITLISFVPVIGIITPLLIFIVQAYFNGVLMTDYSLESKGYDVKTSEDFFSKNKPAMFSIGLGFMFLLLIPVIGWFIAPTYALTASALYFIKCDEKKIVTLEV